MQKVVYGLFLAFTSVALVGCGDGPCDAGFSFKYCLNQSSSSSSSSTTARLTVGGSVSGLVTGKTMKLIMNPVSMDSISMDNTEAGVSVNFADPGLQVSDNRGIENTAGWGFKVTSNRLMTHLGVWSHGGLYGDVDLGLWDGSGNLLSSISILNGNIATYGVENDFSYAVLPTSVLLTSGQTYTLGGFYKGGVLAAYGAPVTPINDITYATPSLVDFSSALVQPTLDLSESYPNGYFGPNLRFLMGASEQITVSIDGSFTFPTALVTGDPYVVEVIEQPADQSCSILNGNGTVASVPVTTVIVTCSALQ